MPVEAKPLFRPEVLGQKFKGFEMPERLERGKEILQRWAKMIASGEIDKFKETEILHDFLTEIFCQILGYTRPMDSPERYTFSREKHVQVDGKFADAVLGEFTPVDQNFLVAVEGKGPRDPLERPFGGRKMSAVDQGYRYAINLPCDWIIVTSIRQTRLYCKACDQYTYEWFDTERIATDDLQLKRFVFLLGSERVVPESGRCHLYELREASEKVGKELTKEFYRRYADIRHDIFEKLCSDNPEASGHSILAATQKLLDRVLFCAFSEDRGLLPDSSLKKAFEHRDPYNPHPVWSNFLGLFRWINLGNEALGIPAYNGGLFAEDPLLDKLRVSDAICAYFKELSTYDYRPAQEVVSWKSARSRGSLIDVVILGHIFEQSITDLEKLQHELDGLIPPQGKDKHRNRRKREGAFYTPSFITRFIVEQTLGAVLKERFEGLRQSHAEAASGTSEKALIDPSSYDLKRLNKPQVQALIKFWKSWQEELATIRVLDPACGSGAFLIEAFDQLFAAYERSNDRLAELSQPSLFDLNRRILQENLYGVDISSEAVEICRLSLWIKTAERGKILTSLDHTIRAGNSVIDDKEVDPRAFDWKHEFPEVFNSGGFDVIVGNPPYIRSEWLLPYKSHWQDTFQSYHGSADIFSYFYERGIKLLRENGRLGFITSGSWVFSNFGQSLRQFLAENTSPESLVDFGEFQPFEGAEMIRPTIAIFRRYRNNRPLRVFKWLSKGHPPENLSDVMNTAPLVTTTHLGRSAWELDGDDVRRLKLKMVDQGIPLSNYCGNLLFRGVVTGLNEAFLIDTAKKSELISSDPKSNEIIHRYIMGTDISNWHLINRDRFIIFTKQGCNIAQYPAIREHLQRFRDRLTPKPSMEKTETGRKPGSYRWYEIQDTTEFFSYFQCPKIIWPDIAKRPRFVVESNSAFLDATCCMIPLNDPYLLGILASWATWFLISKSCQPLRLRGDRWQYRLKKQWIARLPIPQPEEGDKKAIGDLSRNCNTWGQERYDLQERVRQRMIQGFGQRINGTALGKLNQEAGKWWNLSLNQLGAALQKSFKLARNPFENPKVAEDWEEYLNQKKAEVENLSEKIEDAEAELNDRVFRLFQLSHANIEFLQREVEH